MALTFVQTRFGALEGVSLSETVSVFRGVPYAKAPVGELRFRRPVPCEPWEGVKKADRFSAVCLQGRMPKGSFYHKEFYSEDDNLPQSEDCLYLNIWTPAKSEKEKLPVLFWIHGGGFDHGWGFEKEFDGEAFAEKGVILVTINYRCNIFGFLKHPWLDEENEEHISGNYGIFDQIAALQWVRDNISFFGGDPDNITIDGQSAGGMSVQTLISTDLTRGMIAGAILQSGGGFGGLRLGGGAKEAEETGVAFVRSTGAKDLFELRAMPAEKLFSYYVAFKEGRFAPHVDGYLLKAEYTEIAKSGALHDSPYMIGTCVDEGKSFGNGFLTGTLNFVNNQLELGRTPAYFYCFDRKLPGDDSGSFHSSELWYQFKTLSRCWRPMTKEDYALSEIINSYWANFAKAKNPNGEGLPNWEPYTKEEKNRQLLKLQVETEQFEE